MKRALITWVLVVCCICLTVWGCTTSQEETGILEGFLWSFSSLEGKTATETTPCEHTSSNSEKTNTIPSGYLELTVMPAEVCADTGEQIEIHCAIYSLVNTPVEITSVELVVFDSDEALLREQAMTKDSYWSAYTSCTIVGDEAYYRLRVNFTTPYAQPGEYSEFTADSFPIAVN